MILVTAFLSFGLFATPVLSSLHGKSLGVTISQDSKTKINISFQQLKGRDSKGQSIWGKDKVINVTLKKNEVFSAIHNFHCTDDSGESYYATFNPRKIKKTKPTKVLRAWRIDKKNNKIVPVRKTSSIACEWVQQGDEAFPFKL